MIKHIRTDVSQNAPYGLEKDACAVYFGVRKRGRSTFGTLRRSLKAVAEMGHRTGFFNGEGDGVGVQTDIPRRLWAKILGQAGLRSSITTHQGFWIGHLFVPHGIDYSIIRDEINFQFNETGLTLLVEQPGRVRSETLGQRGRNNPPEFWQLAGFSENEDLEGHLLSIQTRLEKALGIHFASLSSSTVVYKLLGSVETLSRYYPDLQDNGYDTSMALCHARYSTNTVSTFERAQPFALLGHNGEINTIDKLRREAEQINVGLPFEASDSQIVDRVLHTLCVDYGLDLIEAMEMVFPITPHHLEKFSGDMREAYSYIRQSFGPFSQGPAAIAARFGNCAVLSVDALGLRPLWFIETEKEYIFSSERGVIPFETIIKDPRPLSPGEKMAVLVQHGQNVRILDHTQIRQLVISSKNSRWVNFSLDGSSDRVTRGNAQRNYPREPSSSSVISSEARLNISTLIKPETLVLEEVPAQPIKNYWGEPGKSRVLDSTLLAANGWQREQIREIMSIAQTGDDPVSSLGYDGPLAILSRHRVNLADYFKETVAVVTNPAIDRGRETEVFSTRALIGARPPVGDSIQPNDTLVAIDLPLLLGGHLSVGEQNVPEEVARRLGTLTIERLMTIFGDKVARLTLGVYEGESVFTALQRISNMAVQEVLAGAQCLILDDLETNQSGLNWLDPLLTTACIDEALRNAKDPENLRRKTGVVLRSASVRNLHDIILLCGLGADAIAPYAMLEVSLKAHTKHKIEHEEEQILALYRLLSTMKVGLEKVISTIGCHELRGFGRVFSSIGLAPSIAKVLKTPNYFGNENIGLTWEQLDIDASQRGAEMRGEAKGQKPAKVKRLTPQIWKKFGAFAKSNASYRDVVDNFRELTAITPVAMRHILGIRQGDDVIDPNNVDICVSDYKLPLVIGAMSFGSQGENSFKAYAEAAALLDIICINGEGGELPELMGVYHKSRGQQVASGRFGVNAALLNSASVIEIKIGQGAKPGEGGMLPGSKVIPRVAEARHTPAYIPLLSPYNNHDLYSIEDLAQLIEELKVVNPDAKVSVKCPVVPNIGVIAVGVAKAGADIINLTGYDGGTGAARKHAIQHVGLPAEIGVIQAHRALVEAGLRNQVELWCDGGMRTGEDAVKMILLGANRVGFATMAMIAVGCTACRKCHEGNCHVGITTHIKSIEEAKDKGLRTFEPCAYPQAVERIVNLFEGIGQEMRQLTAQMGAKRLQDLVGRGDLLEQTLKREKVDLSAMLEPVPLEPNPTLEAGVGFLLTRPRNNLTRFMSELIVENVSDGKREVTYQDEIKAFDRALGSHLAGEITRKPMIRKNIDCLHLRFGPSSVAGNGFAAWTTEHMDILIEGGAQDGVAKGASGGRVAVMKGLNYEGQRIDGSVGKSFAYGAQSGTLIVQGNADSRACIRLSGAEVILGGEITEPVNGRYGDIGINANLKGFACEYMTSGRVIIMGDPGTNAFAGMTGGVVYQKLTPELGFDEGTLVGRIAAEANVTVKEIDSSNVIEIQGLLMKYIEALSQTQQFEQVEKIRLLSTDESLKSYFVKIVPVVKKDQETLKWNS
ncbi:MAG: glutamate synthase [Chloroflexi bacterium]|nr:glutamate synthase [Chloroflexota bacterium]